MTPPSGSATLQLEQALACRTRSAARRILSGAGAASFVAFRIDPERGHPVIAHGLTTRGDFVVALLDERSSDWGDEPVKVRCDIRREAAEPRVRITSATVHMLGDIDWMTEEGRTSCLKEGVLPETIVTVAGLPGLRIGTIRVDRVLVHDSSGATPLSFDEIVDGAPREEPFPQQGDELAAHDVIAATTVPELHDVCEAVRGGRLVGRLLAERPSHQPCVHVRGEVFCVDIDEGGVTLMRVGDEVTDVVYGAFRGPVRDLAGLRTEIDYLIRCARH
ncbi:hypothetical protein [Austwickia chelonae]|uniref:hypothetical protein n=1 Tax=Austwickia chelonae TaxID=100225 RepID=UPI000E284F24|nr:hypothetical protein [Austwickia chelonae]